MPTKYAPKIFGIFFLFMLCACGGGNSGDSQGAPDDLAKAVDGEGLYGRSQGVPDVVAPGNPEISVPRMPEITVQGESQSIDGDGLYGGPEKVPFRIETTCTNSGGAGFSEIEFVQDGSNRYVNGSDQDCHSSR